MTDPAALRALADRVERSPYVGIARAAAEALGWSPKIEQDRILYWQSDYGKESICYPDFSSVESILAEAARRLPGWEWGMGVTAGGGAAWAYFPEYLGNPTRNCGFSLTLAAAMLAALLRAMAAEAERKGT
jgi:hypothetical protein